MNRIPSLQLFLFAILLLSCSKTKEEHLHQEKLQLTAYNDFIELFVEATPFVVGHESKILAHFTRLSDFKPLEECPITVSLIVGSDTLRQRLEKPAQPGIYRLSFTPNRAGEALLLFEIANEQTIPPISISKLTIYNDSHEAAHEAEESRITSSNGAVFTKEQSWKVDFATEESRLEPFGAILKTVAQLLPAQGDEQIVSAKTSGIIRFSSRSLTEGAAVSFGHSLFQVVSAGMADNNMASRFQEATNEYLRTKTEYERKAKLADEQLVSASELLRVKAAFENAQINYDNLQLNFSSAGQVVQAPFAGFIKELRVVNGQYVEAGDALLTISQNRHLYIKAELNQKHFPLLDKITTAQIQPLHSTQTYTLEELEGRVVSYAKSVDAANPLIPITFEVINSGKLLPGSFIQLYIKTLTNETSITIPNESLIEEMGNYFVYRQLTPELFEKSEVKIGQSDGCRTEILHGLSAGVRIVNKGAIIVKLAQAAGGLDAHSGHVH